MKSPKFVLSALCAVACFWTAEMVIGLVAFPRGQGISTRKTIFELSMFLGASLLPLIGVWLAQGRRRIWLIILWGPCVLYVLLLAVNLARFSPFAGATRILLWVGISILFLRESVTPERPNQASLPWFSALAFLWMPIGCALAFLAAKGSSSADDMIMWASFLLIPIACTIAAIRVSQSDMPRKGLWSGLNAVVAGCALIAGIAAFFLVLQLLSGWARR